jgi:WD40 repeat protein/tRNA A-37 threonylcarbamoyl transferase component Bud32
MIFCINPDCQQPKNADDAATCKHCGSTLVLRGRYRPLRMLGQGGFGRTYLALDGDRLDTSCVIKQLLPQQLAGSGLDEARLNKIVELFKQEAMQLSKLGEHPQIPALLAFFEHETRLYLVQEFIDGETLWHEVETQGAFSEQQVRLVLAQLLPVLKYIHRHGVVHRDITPVNILRRKRDNKLILIDFGVAKQLTQTSLARPGTKVGTAGYAPLEQLRSGKAYPASDIYSLGVTCLHLLTQTRPDMLYDPLQGWRWREQLARRRVSISDGLGAILDKMVKDMVVDRYQTVDEAIEDFKLLAGASAKSSLPKSTTTQSPSSSKASRTSAASQPQAQKQTTNPPIPTSPLPVPSPPTSLSRLKTTGWSCTHNITDHSSWITSVAISPQGLMFASGCLDNKIRLWYLQTGQTLQTLTQHKGAVNSVAISPNGLLLASGSDDDTIKIWDLQTGQAIKTLADHFRDVTCVAFTPDSQRVVSGSKDRTIKVWNVSNGQLLTTLAAGSGMIRSVVVSPNGQILASGGIDNNVYLWNLSTFKPLATLSGHFNSVNSIAISSDGTMLASGSKDRTIKVWQLPTGKLINTLSGHLADVNGIVFHPNNQMLISCSSDEKVKIWQIGTGEVQGTLSGHLGAVNSVAVSLDGKTIVSGSCDKTVKVWHWSN